MRYATTLAILLLAGCAAAAQTPQPQVNVKALLPRHPLYGTLAQYDRQIAVLQATLHTEFADSSGQIESASAAIDRDLTHAQNALPSARAHVPSFRWNIAAGTQPSRDEIEAAIIRTYEDQRTNLRTAATGDMASYRADLNAQQRQQLVTFAQSVTASANRAYAARAQELQEKESGVLLELARRNAPVRLQVRAKLQTLALSQAARTALQQRLIGLQRQEDAAVGAMHGSDARILAAYQAALEEKARRQIVAMEADLQARTRANLEAREHVARDQLAASTPLQLPAGQHPRSGSLPQMQGEYRRLLQTQTGDAQRFAGARSDLLARFRAVRQMDADQRRSIESQIASLRHDREAVRKRMVAQILAEARRLAAQGYAGDLTSAVAADLRSLSP